MLFFVELESSRNISSNSSVIQIAERKLESGLLVGSSKYELVYYILSHAKRQIAVPPVARSWEQETQGERIEYRNEPKALRL